MNLLSRGADSSRTALGEDARMTRVLNRHAACCTPNVRRSRLVVFCAFLIVAAIAAVACSSPVPAPSTPADASTADADSSSAEREASVESDASDATMETGPTILECITQTAPRCDAGAFSMACGCPLTLDEARAPSARDCASGNDQLGIAACAGYVAVGAAGYGTAMGRKYAESGRETQNTDNQGAV